jgi:hypothetical protein
VARSLIVVAGALANKPWNGGAAWTRLSWTLGFARLGYDVYFVEQIDTSDCVDASGAPCPVELSVNEQFFTAVTKRFGLHAALIVVDEQRVIGASWEELDDIAERADLLINISGHLTVPALKAAFAKRVFIDLDPGYTQFWHAGRLAELRLRGHHHYFTVGENIGTAGCTIETDDIEWRPIRQPVVLDEWAPAPPVPGPVRFTTIASWRGPLGNAQLGDLVYGVKAHEFRRFASLPSKSDLHHEIALEIDPADGRDVDTLRDNGWVIVDAREVVPDPDSFRGYVQGSHAECSVAQGVYVDTACGWFSDRSVRYLASGKPVLVQDTGWTRNYPSGAGLLAFSTLDEAAAGARCIARDYERHSAQAVAIAREYFDSSKVLTGLLESVS